MRIGGHLRSFGVAGIVIAALCGCRSNAPAPPATGPAAPPPPPATGAPVAAPSPHPIDLATALRVATASHLDILDARARLHDAKGKAEAGDGGLYPTLWTGASMGGLNGEVQNVIGKLQEAKYSTTSALGTVKLSMNVGEAIYRDLAAHRLLDAAGRAEEAVSQRVLLSVTEQYLDLVEAEATIRLQERLLDVARATVRVAETREAQGVGSALDTERARTQVATIEQALLSARSERQRRSKLLAAALRLDATVDLVPLDTALGTAALVDPATPLAEWLDRSTRLRPERAVLGLAENAAEKDAQATKWGAWGPEVSAAYQAGGLGTDTSDVDERKTWSVVLGWTWTGASYGRIHSAEARVEQAKLAQERFDDQLRAVVAASFEDLQIARDQLAPAEREMESGDKALTIAQTRFEGGLLPVTDLLLVEQAADRARLRELSARLRYAKAQARLLTESGAATAEALVGGKH